VSISLFPGAINADISGHAGSFLQRARRIVGTCICFILSGGDLEGLTEDVDVGRPNLGNIRDGTETTVQHQARRQAEPLLVEPQLPPSAQPQLPHPARPLSAQPQLPHPEDPLESTKYTKVYHRATTSLYAGTAPDAGRLNGKVGVFGLPNCPWLIDLPDT
jgi:hypothetical protein